MSISRRIARPLLSSMFVFGGLDAARHPETKVKAAERVTQPLAQKVPAIPDDAETLVRLNGIVQLVAGLALAVGKFRRLAALALIGSIIPTTVAGHAFWEEDDEVAKRQQQIHFLKNLGLVGGLIIAAFDTEGAPSLGWRAKRKARRIGQVVSAGGAVKGAKSAKSSKGRGLRKRRAAKALTPAAVATVGRQAKRSLETVGSQLQGGSDRAANLLSAVPERAGQVIAAVPERAGQVIAAVPERAGVIAACQAGQVIAAVPERAGSLSSPPCRRSGPAMSSLPAPSGPGMSSLPAPSGPAMSSPPAPSGPAMSSPPAPSGPAMSSPPCPSGPDMSSLPAPSGRPTSSQRQGRPSPAAERPGQSVEASCMTSASSSTDLSRSSVVGDWWTTISSSAPACSAKASEVARSPPAASPQWQ